MARLKSSDQLESLRRAQIEIAKKIKEAEARDREKTKEKDQRRREIAGRTVLDYLDANPDTPLADNLRNLLAEAIKRPTDRALFPQLPPLPAPPANPPDNEAAAPLPVAEEAPAG